MYKTIQADERFEVPLPKLWRTREIWSPHAPKRHPSPTCWRRCPGQKAHTYQYAPPAKRRAVSNPESARADTSSGPFGWRRARRWEWSGRSAETWRIWIRIWRARSGSGSGSRSRARATAYGRLPFDAAQPTARRARGTWRTGSSVGFEFPFDESTCTGLGYGCEWCSSWRSRSWVGDGYSKWEWRAGLVRKWPSERYWPERKLGRSVIWVRRRIRYERRKQQWLCPSACRANTASSTTTK